MAKTLNGIVTSVRMNGVFVIEVTRRFPHPKYQKLLKRSKKFKAALNGNTVSLGDTVEIVETRPISKDVHFAFSTLITEKKGAKK